MVSVIKKIILILYMYSGVIAQSDNYVSFGAGPTWINLDYRDRATVKNDATLHYESIFVVQKAQGFSIDINSKYQIKSYLTPYIDIYYARLNKGTGFGDAFLIRNHKRVEDLERVFFNTFIQSTAFVIADQIRMIERENDCRHIALDVLLGYSYSKFLLIADWQTDRGISNSIYKGFVGALKCYWDYGVISFALEDYVYPEHIRTVSTRDSLLGNDAGVARYLLIGNSLVGIMSYQLSTALLCSVLVSWSYYKNVGEANIILTQQEQETLTEPKLCLSKANQYSLLFSVGSSF